jgi:ABC-type Fe3+ transport system permease subunit
MAKQHKSMAKQHGSKKSQSFQQTEAPKKQQNTVRKAFTIVICVVVALSLMLPVAGLSATSCSPTETQQSP